MITKALCLTSLMYLVYGNEVPSERRNLNQTAIDYGGGNDTWWGPKTDKAENTSVRRIQLQFTEEMIVDLKYRLKHRRPITPSLEGAWFEYGVNSQVLEDWLEYWEHEYPFTEREEVINLLPHYRTSVQGLDIHFVWARPEVPSHVKVLPLLLTNGWPSSFTDFHHVIPRLLKWSKDRDFAIEVISPTIPGLTLSEAAVRPGLGPPAVATIFRKLMHRLGHKKYYIAAGDLGYFISNCIATAYPEEVLGFFTQMVVLYSPTAIIPYVTSTVSQFSGSIYVGNFSARTREDAMRQFGYIAFQSTTPDALGNALKDSPSGLLGYLLQMFYFGRVLDRRENAKTKIQDHIPRDDFLDNIMLYWITGCIGTSMRFYAEFWNTMGVDLDETPTPVLTWVTQPKYELIHHPQWVVKTKYPNLISYRTLDFGGHFFPSEFPEFYADEIITALTAFEKIHTKNSKDIVK